MLCLCRLYLNFILHRICVPRANVALSGAYEKLRGSVLSKIFFNQNTTARALLHSSTPLQSQLDGTLVAR